MIFETIVACALFFLFLYWSGDKLLRPTKPHSFPSGPRGIPYFGYLPFLGSVPCVTIANLSKTWGPIFSLKLGQYPVVFINDFDTIRELYKLDATTGRAQLSLFEKRGKYGLGLLEGEQWREVKRFVLKCLRDAGFGKKQMESSIQEEVLQTIQFLKKNTEKPLYLKPLIELTVVNAFWCLIASEKYEIADPKAAKVAQIITEGISDQNIVGIAAFLPTLAKLFPKLSGYEKGLKYFDAPKHLVKGIISKHMEMHSPGNEKDFIDHALTKIMNTSDPQSMFYKDIGMKNLHYTLIDMFFAGSDTISSTLGWTFLYLAIYPDEQKKVHQEIYKEIGNRTPSLEDRTRMPYTEATMCEVMRKSSMVPLGLMHTAIEDMTFEEYVFPKGTIFLSNLYQIHHDQKYWSDPECFRPSRFLSENGSFKKNERLIPFFMGKRTCPGENLAMVEYFLFFTGIMQKFEFSLNPDEPVPDIGPRSGLIIQPPKHTLLIKER